MWPEVFRHLFLLAAAILTGWAIRLMDDAQDIEIDRLTGRDNLAARLEEGTTAYALGALALGVICSPAASLSLFAAAYAVGMAGNRTILPTGLPAVVEGTMLWSLTLLRYGWRSSLAALLIMLTSQLLDDWLDRSLDAQVRARNWARRLGAIGIVLVSAFCGCGALLLSPQLTISAALAFTYFQYRDLVVTVPCKG